METKGAFGTRQKLRSVRHLKPWKGSMLPEGRFSLTELLLRLKPRRETMPGLNSKGSYDCEICGERDFYSNNSHLLTFPFSCVN